MSDLIRWTGSKSTQARKIVGRFPPSMERYVEPFLGGGSVFQELLGRKDVDVGEYVLSDKCSELVAVWKAIVSDPTGFCDEYEYRHNNFVDRGQKFYYEVRDRFNEIRDAHDFYFLTRTCINGLIRFNSDGNFNAPVHHGRTGADPEYVRDSVFGFYNTLSRTGTDVTFSCCDYKEHEVKPNDFAYIDPPYKDSSSMYFSGFDHESFFEWLSDVPRFCMSFDGNRDGGDLRAELDADLYDNHVLLDSGQSSMGRIVQSANQANVKESLYTKL